MNQYIHPDILNELVSLSCDRASALFEELGIKAREEGRRWVGCCPSHESDNENAWNFYPDGEFSKGNWQCHTRGCQAKFGKGLIGLIRSILTFREEEECSFFKAIDFLLSFNNIKLKDIKIADPTSREKRDYQKTIRRLNNKGRKGCGGMTREEFRKKVQIPCPYFLSRNYSPSLLDRYDVGLYNGERVLIPVYDDEYKWVVGHVARSIHEKCRECGLYHKSGAGKCPMGAQKNQCAKWLNSRDFEASTYLFNYWFAAPHIKKSRVVILTEGVGDTLRLEELGIHNSLCIFGTELTGDQRSLIDRSGAMSVIVLLDNDEAGRKGAEKIKEGLGRSYRLFFPTIQDDPGSLNEDEVTKEILPLIKRLSG